MKLQDCFQTRTCRSIVQAGETGVSVTELSHWTERHKHWEDWLNMPTEFFILTHRVGPVLCCWGTTSPPRNGLHFTYSLHSSEKRRRKLCFGWVDLPKSLNKDRLTQRCDVGTGRKLKAAESRTVSSSWSLLGKPKLIKTSALIMVKGWRFSSALIRTVSVFSKPRMK